MSSPAIARCVSSSSADSTSVLLTTPGSSGRVNGVNCESAATVAFSETASAGIPLRSGGQPEPSDHAAALSSFRKNDRNCFAASCLRSSPWSVIESVRPMADAACVCGPARMGAIRSRCPRRPR